MHILDMALEIKLSRCDNTPWGFRLVGGTDFEYPITVSKVLESSLAEHSGLLDGDVIIDVNERPASRLTHEGAHDVIMQAGNQCVLRVVRADEYRNPLNAEPGDFAPVPAINQGFTPISTPLGHEVPDHRTRGCESPFTPASKPYRPFSTEPIIGIPPLEEPIILDPRYQDDFTKIQLKDFEPDTIFKLEKANEKYTNCRSNFSEIARDGYLEVNSTKLSYTVQNGLSEKCSVDVKNIEETARSLVDENVSKAFQVSDQMKKGIDSHQRKSNYETFDMNQNILNESKMNDICVENNVSVINDKDSSEILFGTFKQEQKESLLTDIVDKSVKTEIVKDNNSEMTECTAIPQIETSEDSKSSPMERSRCDNENFRAMESGKISMTKRLGNNMIVNENGENNISTIDVKCGESKTKDIQESTNYTSISDVSTKGREQETVSVSECSEKAVKTNEKQAYSSKLLKESAILRSQTIPGLQGTIYSTHKYDLLLKTFFIHLTDVMVALSRLLMTDQSLSRSVSPMPTPKKESATQKLTEVVDGQTLAGGHQSRLSQFQSQSQKVSVSRNETARNNRNASAETKFQVTDKSELDAKIDEILGQRDPLEWLAELDERSNSGFKNIAGSEELDSRNDSSTNREGVIMWEGHSHLISQNESIDLQMHESAKSDATTNTTAQEEMIKDILTQNQETQAHIEDICEGIVKEPNIVESIEETLNDIEPSGTKIENSVTISNQILKMNESRIEGIENFEQISDSKESKVEAINISNEHLVVNESVTKDIQIIEEISETKETVKNLKENRQINESQIKEVQICEEIFETKESKVESINISNAKFNVNESESKDVQICKEIFETEESKVESINISDEKFNVNESESKDVQICEEIFETKESKVESINISNAKFNVNESESKDVQICKEIFETEESKVESINISDEKFNVNESESKDVQICKEIFETKESKVESINISNAKFNVNESESKDVQICKEIFETEESKVESINISNAKFNVNESESKDVQICKEIFETEESKVESINISDEKFNVNESESKDVQICEEIFETKESKVESINISNAKFNVNESESKDVQICKEIFETKESKVESINISNAKFNVNESESKDVQICKEIFETEESKVESINISDEKFNVNESESKDVQICEEIFETKESKVESINISNAKFNVNESESKDVQICKEIFETKESKVESINISNEKFNVNESESKDVQICKEIFETEESKVESINISDEKFNVNESESKDVQICEEIFETEESKVESINISDEKFNVNESESKDVQICEEIFETKESKVESINISNAKFNVNESESKDVQICKEIFETEESKVESINISDEKFNVNESESKDVQICKEIFETEESKVESINISDEKFNVNESESKDVQICEEIFETKESKVESINISNEKFNVNESESKDVQICEEIFETKASKVESMNISNEKFNVNESESKDVQICEEISETKESEVETNKFFNEYFEMNERRVEAVEISNAISMVEHESIQISNELSKTEKSEIDDDKVCSEKIEINENEVECDQTYSGNFKLDKTRIEEAVEPAEEVSEEENIKESSIIIKGITDIVQDSSFSQNSEAVLKQTEYKKEARNLDQMTESVSSVTEIEHKNLEATVSEAYQVREQSATEIEAETDQCIPAPQTPLTDEYIFRLELKLVESRSPSKSPARMTKKPPKPKPETQHEDPHIVKKPKLIASIETEIETSNSFTNKTDDPSIKSTQCTENDLETKPFSNPKTLSSTAYASSMATNSNTEAALCLEEISSCTSKTDSTIDIGVNTNTFSNTYSNSNNALNSETSLGTPTNSTTGAQQAPMPEEIEVVEGKKCKSTNNIGSDTTSNSEITSSTPTNSANETTLSTPIPSTIETISTFTLTTEATSITATDSSTKTALSTLTTSSTNIALSTASTCTSQQHENAQIAEDIGIIEQQLPGKETKNQTSPNDIIANENIESPVNETQNAPKVEENCIGVQKSTEGENEDSDNLKKSVDLKDKNQMDNTKEIVIVDQKVLQNENEDDLGKPGLSDEQIATLMSGESEVLKGQHIIGLTKVLASHMSRELDEDDDSSINFKKMKPQIEALKDSEVLKILNEEMLKTKEEKKREERKYTTFLQRPNRPIPLGGNLWYNQPPPQEKYKVKIVKQPKPRVAPDAPKNFETGLLPWEQRKLNEPPPPPIEREDPILVPEEGPEYLEALDNLPESAVPDLEDTGLPPPPEPVPKEEDHSEKTEDLEFITEGDTGDELEDLSEALTEEEKVEMEQSKMAMNVLCNIEDTVDPNMSIEEQLAVMHSQLLALSQLPAAIQHTLEAVTQQLSKIVPHASDKSKIEKQPASENEQIDANIDQGERVESESHPTEEYYVPSQAVEDSVSVATPERKVEEKMIEEEEKTSLEKSEMIRKEVQASNEQERTIDQSKKELIAELELEHQQRQVKQRPTARVGRPKPVFGPLVPQERPMILPGGRKWRRPKDAYNDDFIAETLTAQAEILQGKVKGLPYESVRLPYDQRINFMKYEKPVKSLDYLKDSSVYKLVHETDVPGRGLEVRPAMVLAESEFREKCRSVTPVNIERAQVQEEHLDIPQQLQP